LFERSGKGQFFPYALAWRLRVAIYGAARMRSGLRKGRDAVELDDRIDRAGGGGVHHAGVFRVRPRACDANFRARRGASGKQRDDTRAKRRF